MQTDPMRQGYRKERERQMEALEQEMEGLRKQMQRTLDQDEGRRQRRRVLGWIRSLRRDVSRRVNGGPARRMDSSTDLGRAYLGFWAKSLEQYQQTMDNFFRLYTGRPPRSEVEDKG